MNEMLALEKRLEALKEEHRLLDEEIRQLEKSDRAANEFMIKRNKQMKLRLRDSITEIEAILYPDVVA